jgi:hypothetical protein
MTYDDARVRLTSHSNLPGTNLAERDSFVWQLWNAEQTGLAPNLDLWNDVVSCLEIVNQKWNGPIPSESRPQLQHRQIPADLVYAVSGIISAGLRYHRHWSRTGRFDSSVCASLEECTCKIAYAWDQVLAGDVDDTLEGYDIESAI